MSAEEFRELARRHGYDPRGIGGFFSGANFTMSRAGGAVELTPQGRRVIQYRAPAFRDAAGDEGA